MLDRIQEEDDNANNQTVLYGHDPLGRVTAITYPGNFALNNFYDALGRLTNQVDRAGRQMSYTYDLADRLQTRRYPNGVVQTNGFDDAGRLTGLSYASPNISTNSPIQIALSYAYDSNGNKTGDGESGTFNWPVPSLTDDNSQFTAAGRLKSRQIQNNSAISNQLSQITYNYDANGNMTNASGNGQAWTLAYDEDNRTTSIQWDAGITSKNITNRYDAFGRRISKTTDGVTTGYVLSLVGGMEKVLCDLDGNGNVTAWYVHGPDLCYRVDSTNGLLCYHADAMGNIIALTDGNTNLVAQYAYTPYGRSLGSTNLLSLISNPYLFVGSQGVMEESDIPNLFFMRARYYSADAGVFLSTDSIKKVGPGWKPVLYMYSNANPLSKTDSTGLEPFSDLIMAGGAMIGDLGLQIYKYAHDPNYQCSVSELWIAGATAAASTEVAEDTAIFATGIGATAALTEMSSIAAGALVNGAGNIVQQSVNKGFQNVDYGEVSENVLIAGLSDGISRAVPNISMNGQLYWHDVTGPGFGTSHLINSSIHSIVGAGSDSIMHGISDSSGQTSSSGGGGGGGGGGAMCSYTATTAAPHVAAINNITATTASSPYGGMCMAPSSSSVSSGGGSRSSSTATSTPTTSSSSTSFFSQVGSVISSVASSIGNFFGSFFH
jgi:RHS repeat-associated protein